MPARRILTLLPAAVSSRAARSLRPGWLPRLFAFRSQLPLPLKVSLTLLAWLSFIALWQAIATNASSGLVPTPARVATALQTLFAEREFATDVIQSVKRISFSFLIALVIALPLGIAMGTYPPVEAFLNALVSPFRYLPAPSFIPLLLMWLGTGESQKIALLILGVVFFLISLIMDHTKAVDHTLIECARTLGAKRSTLIWKVIFPAALPAYLDTARQLLAVSWTYLVIAEIVAATDGIGAMMMRAKRFVKVDDIMAGILVIGILGLLFDLTLRQIHRASFRYLR